MLQPDGHCMYRAVEDQLEVHRDGGAHSTHDYTLLREKTADYIRNHKDELLPFIIQVSIMSARSFLLLPVLQLFSLFPCDTTLMHATHMTQFDCMTSCVSVRLRVVPCHMVMTWQVAECHLMSLPCWRSHVL